METQDLAMLYAGVPVAFPPACGKEAREFLEEKLVEEATGKPAPDQELAAAG